jgi:hypothetical protein
MQDEGYPDDPNDSSDSDFERICENPLEKAFFDKKHIEKLLASGTSGIILQTVRSKNSHCRAWNCPSRIITGMPNIRSDFRFNLKDLSGRHAVDQAIHNHPVYKRLKIHVNISANDNNQKLNEPAYDIDEAIPQMSKAY